MNRISNSYIEENMEQVHIINDVTSLCVYKPTGQIYVAKQLPKENISLYKKIKKISNMHLAEIFYISENENDIVVYTEYISGKSLASIIETEKKLPIDRAKEYAIGICEGLSVLHENEIVHRDINPNNIIISSDNIVKIIDYGIIRKTNPNKPQDTVIMGTPGYAAPEQFGFSQTDCRSDIYALGVLLNVMLTGEMPNVKLADLPLQSIIKKCIEIDSNNRFSDINSVKAALNNEVTRNSSRNGIIAKIPGIRSKKKAVKIISSIAYVLVVLIIVSLYYSGVEQSYNLYILTLSIIFSTGIPFVLFNNFLGIWDKNPLTKNAVLKTKKAFNIVLGIVSLIIGLVLFGLS